MALAIRGNNPIWTEFDLAGNLFDDNFYMYVLQNQIPYIPATVWSDPDFNTVLAQPIQFLGNGTLPIDIYFEADTVYRLEFRQNNGLVPPSQSDPLIYLVENYVPGSGGSSPISTVAFATSNEITNPQFALVNFVSPFTYTGAASSLPSPINVAPGWYLSLAGSGTVTINQIPLNNSNPSPTNAPYALQITVSGWTANSVYLYQRFEQNGQLWANQFVSSSITATLGTSGLPQNISAILVDSNGTTLGTVLNTVAIGSGNFNEYVDVTSVPLPASSNPDLPPAAWIEYQLKLPSNIDIYVTSIQLVVQDAAFTPNFEQDSVNRQIDHMFNVFKDPLFFKPIPSYAIGWDFPFNPCQALGKTINLSGSATPNQARYICDQTICFESVGNVLSATITTPGGLTLKTASATQLALIQYLDAETANELSLNEICSQIKGYLSAAQTSVSGNITLWVTTNGSVPTLPATFFTTLTAGVPSGTITAGWTQIPRAYGPANFTFLASDQGVQGNVYPFNGFNLPPNIAGQPTFFAIVVGFDSLNTSGSGEGLVINHVSLQAGSVPTQPAPLNAAQTLQALQYYYQKSFIQSVVPATNVGANKGESNATQTVPASTIANGAICVQFSTAMIKTPGIVLYNPVANNGEIHNFTFVGDYTGTVTGNINTKNFTLNASSNSGSSPGNLIGINWTADARLGVV